MLPYLPFDVPFPPRMPTRLRGVASDRPVVGFCGMKNSLTRARSALLDTLSAANSTMRTNFILRRRFMGGPASVFDRNLNESHFVVSTRGRGNFAIRLYQALAAGRIPVLSRPAGSFLLPLENAIPWER